MGSANNGNDGSMFLPGMEPKPDEGKSRVSADPNIPLRAEHLTFPDNRTRPVLVQSDPATEPYVEPRWARRLKLVVFVMLCIELGLLLVVLPWIPLWTHNSLFEGRDWLKSIAVNHFTRGAVTGLGLINVWMGIWEAVTYRDKK